MSPVLTTLLSLILLGGASQAASGLSESFDRGKVLEHVPSGLTEGQQYSLYLPTRYDRTKPAPILFLMDPRGRARVPIRLFQSAAERYGYILISSYSSASDGPLEPNLRAMQSMWDDAQRWFSVDPHRVYVGGFSGTARMATLLAHTHPDVITGVIGVGAGFDPDVAPATATPFPYFAAVGDVDYNFHELHTLENTLAARDWPHRLVRFPGPHSWMPADVATQAIEWFELRAMHAGTRPPDATLLDAWWTRDDTTARRLSDAARVLDAARLYTGMARDFSGLRPVSGAATAAATLAASPAGLAERHARDAAVRRSTAWLRNAMQAIADAFPPGAIAPLDPIEHLAQTLELTPLRQAAAAGTTETGLDAQRRLNELAVQLGFYLPHDALTRSDLSRAGYYLSLALMIDDVSPVTWYLVAQRWALLQSVDQAITALERAVDSGFSDLSLLESDNAFRPLRATSGYRALVAQLQTQTPRADVLTVDRPPVHVRR